MTTRMRITTSLVVNLLLLAIIACAETPASPTPATPARIEATVGVQPTQEPPPPVPTLTPLPPATPLPPPTPTEPSLQSRIVPGGEPNTRVVDGEIYVWYKPCEPTIIDAVAPIILTDLRSDSHLYLDRYGFVRTSPRPDYRTDEGRKRFEALLEDSSLMKLVTTFPECPKIEREPAIRHLEGWPDPNAVDIGEPPLPQVSLVRGGRSYRGWRGSYCWPTSANTRTCEDIEGWEGLDKASPVKTTRGRDVSVVVAGDDSSQGQVQRVQVFPILETEPVLKIGDEVYSSHAEEGLTPERLILDIPPGVYLLTTFYKSLLGEVSHGFKIEILPRKVALRYPDPPPLRPQVSLEHGGRSYQGRRGSYCWPVSAASRVCAHRTQWRRFDEVPPVLMKRGDEFSVVVTSDDSSPREVKTSVFTVLETEPVLKMGEEVYSSDALDRITLDIPPGFYVLSTSYKSQLGDVSYGFKLEIED